MTDEPAIVDNLPDVRDINVLLQAMESIGAIIDRRDRHSVRINASMISGLVIEDDYIKKIMSSYYLLGALLGKYKHAEVALPGGCNIGSRKIDLHIKGFKALGAEVKIEHGLIIADAKKLTGAHIYLDTVSVGYKQAFEEIDGLKEYITTPDGNIYSLPNIDGSLHVQYNMKLWINTQWLDNLGLDMPTTTEEFYEVMKAFKEKDANGNGDPNDEIPLSTVTSGAGTQLDGFLMNPSTSH